MARNRVQFQKGLSEPGFERLYGTGEQCRAAVVSSRWPDGFVCPTCGGTRHRVVKARGLYQCSDCRAQTSPIAGTIFASTKLKLRVWFRTLYYLTQTKQGISSIDQVAERLGFSSSEAPVRSKRRNLSIAEPTDRLNLRAAIADINLFVEWCEQHRIPYREGFGLLVRRIKD